MSRRAKIVLLASLLSVVVISVGLEAFTPDPHHDDPAWTVLWWQKPGFHALLGFFGGLVIVWVSLALGRLWLQRPEGYYDE